MELVINGQRREFAELSENSTVSDLLAALQLKGDRVALERNGEIVSRSAWSETPIADGDKIEIVHFVGGGKGSF
ncbi:MAG: sulfur carrier protein ThiS [Acidobacteriaceae bacterium]